MIVGARDEARAHVDRCVAHRLEALITLKSLGHGCAFCLRIIVQRRRTTTPGNPLVSRGKTSAFRQPTAAPSCPMGTNGSLRYDGNSSTGMRVGSLLCIGLVARPLPD